MHIQVPYTHSKNKLDAYSKAKKLITADYFADWDVEINIEYADEHPRIICQGSGFRLQINFEDQSCETYVELAFKYKLFKGTIEKRISKELSSKL
ncbi:MAG: hypothetical protein DRQ88_04275 [Epsilonproteobacteria bacterium]|nr:MAG: hypothetical protein DRQ89_00450 [Campylobacterota bacterium]RLA67117.1 MAG: hypothetical protein DRQ88_04275 [Campylobacterota bacterium]